MRFISRTIGCFSGKLIVTFAVLFLLGGGISWFALITAERSSLMKDAVDHTASYADLILRSIQYDMLTAQRESIQHTIERIGARRNVRIIRIIGNKGRVFFSSKPSEINEQVDRRSGWPANNVSAGEAFHSVSGAAGRWKIYEGRKGAEYLTFLAPIYSEPSCTVSACHVHRADEKILGTLQTDFSLDGVNDKISRQVFHATVFAIVFLCTVSMITFSFVWRFIHRPVSLLAGNMKRIAGGDLSQRVPVDGRDEISQLAGIFNKMVEELERTTVSRDLLIAEIEDHKKTEGRLQESEQFLDTAFKSIHDSFMIVDRDYRITRANEAYSLMRNIPVHDLIGRKCYEVLHQREDICDDCIVAKTFLSGDPCAGERSMLHNGMETWYQVRTYPMPGADGKISHVIEYYADITDRKVAEKAAKQAYLELDQIFNIAADGMCVVDRDFTVQRVNRTFFSIFGLEGKSVIGSKCYEIVPGSECHTARCPLTLIASGEKVLLQYESERLNKDGGPFPCMVFATAFHGCDGKLVGIVADFKDITETKRMEEELRNMSLVDELTGLHNRRGLYTLVERELKIAKRLGTEICLLYADLDGFKAINDDFGHMEGDKILRQTARILQMTFRNADIIARVGGDEFVVVPIGTKSDDVDTVIARLERNIELWNKGKDIRHRLSLSIGVSYYNPESPITLDELLTRADRCMYDNKRNRKTFLVRG